MSDIDFERYLEQAGELKTFFEPGEKVTGRSTAITDNTVFVDIHAKSEGLIDRVQLEKDGELKYAEGDEIEAFFAHSRGGELHLTPLHATLQLRPSFHRVDELDDAGSQV